jgi:hypothetical protein
VKFDKVPMLVKDVRFKTETVDGEERKVVVIALVIDPLGKKLAEMLAPGVVGKVFNGDAKPADDFAGCDVKLHSDLVTLDLRKTSDSVRPSITLLDVQLGKTLRLVADTDRYVGGLMASFRYPEARDLLTLANHVGAQFWISMKTQQGKLLDDE